jgi:flagellin
MPLNINTNSAAATASYFLSKNNAALQKSLNRLSSGSRITKPADDAGGLAVSMKLQGSINRMNGVEKNIGNAISFLQVQDGILESAASIVDRMAELKALSQDVLKNSSDIANYNSEFRNLQVQLFQMGSQSFNGVSLFATVKSDGSTAVTFNTTGSGHTVSIFTSENGESGSVVSINKSGLLAALTIKSTDVSVAQTFQATDGLSIFTFAASSVTNAISLGAVDVGVYSQALQNLATLRAQNGGSVSRLQFSQEAISQQRTNLEAAMGRIVDVDIASESTTLAKYNILVQASASMLAQANATPNVALMLLG